MKKNILCGFFFALVCILMASSAQAQFDRFLKNFLSLGENSRDESVTIAGLKEALTIGAGHAVAAASKDRGYFGHPVIKIPLPENLRKPAQALAMLGYQKQIDDFILRMNRSAEKAAPQAKAIFINAIKQMRVRDAKNILQGGKKAATDYFKTKTSDSIHEAFKPIISSSLSEAGATRVYKEIINKYKGLLPLSAKTPEILDIDQYVTNRAVEGLFYLVGEEEEKIRTDPAARVTDLLKTVFGQ
ncbi:MAG: DUF4197 domain-containing protein [Deltaproteobacteria bacterium]|nr:DUF4197 domain-containing protein [Deltaproteobacteria bacterium]